MTSAGGGELGGTSLPNDVGEFRQGSPLSRWALARFLVGRCIGESVGFTLLLLSVLIFAASVLVEIFLGLDAAAVLLIVVAVAVLLLRWAMLAALRTLTAARVWGPVEDQLRDIVGRSKRDVLVELRRVGLPSHVITLPLLAARLLGRRRAETFERMKRFDVDRAVPAARLDELHMLLRAQPPAR